MTATFSLQINQIWIVLALSLISSSVFASQYEGYDELDRKFRQRIIEIAPLRDPRSDSDQLRPVVNYDGGIIEFDNFKDAKSGPMGEGWQLVGSMADFVSHKKSRYILYGRKNLYYHAGVWNNVLDKARSYQDYLVVKREGSLSKILIQDRLIPTASEIRIGLRRTNDGEGLEVIQNSSSGQAQVIWSYRF